ncbi:hypothetical protein MSAN_02352100 [Mycena sanguinolenta]|uniref:Uncharacterized protein n=1 Tax=Mycena sanguinolenta TaxID=230812 RepID=A0A8H7CH33_9AGAR|nr:hypothetical protein MSAN_02352100 [Mycena sanguinolenta]
MTPNSPCCIDINSKSIILGAIFLIPYNRYILWTLGSASLMLYAVDRQRPSTKLGLLEASIDSVGESLESAKANRTTGRAYVALMNVTSQFCKLKLSVSNIKSSLLETHDVSSGEELKKYVWDTKEIWQSIRRCEKEAKEIRASILRLIEAECQRELWENIQTSCEIIDSLTRRASVVNGRVQSARTSSYEFTV